MSKKNRIEVDEWLDAVEQNKPHSNGTHRSTNYARGKMDRLVRKCRQTDDVIVHRKALSKYIAYMKLSNPFLIEPFHWIYWRYIYCFKTPEWNTETLYVPLKSAQIEDNDFFASWVLIRQDHLITTAASKMVTTMTTEAEQGLEVDTTQS